MKRVTRRRRRRVAFPSLCKAKPRRGAQPANRNAWRHGRRTAAAIQRRKANAASREAAGLILAKLRLLGDYRYRPRAIRHDQLPHLGAEAVALLARLGVIET